MRELFSFFGQRYSAVTTNYNNNNKNETANGGVKPKINQQCEKENSKKFQAKQAFARGCSLLDSLFHQRKAGKGPRWPRGKLLFFFSF